MNTSLQSTVSVIRTAVINRLHKENITQVAIYYPGETNPTYKSLEQWLAIPNLALTFQQLEDLCNHNTITFLGWDYQPITLEQQLDRERQIQDMAQYLCRLHDIDYDPDLTIEDLELLIQHILRSEIKATLTKNPFELEAINF